MGKSNHPLGQRIVIARLCYVEGVMGLKMCWIQIKMGLPLAQNGASLAPFRC